MDEYQPGQEINLRWNLPWKVARERSKPSRAKIVEVRKRSFLVRFIDGCSPGKLSIVKASRVWDGSYWRRR